jgi:diguanylate cyclase (GGDEF)-like protein
VRLRQPTARSAALAAPRATRLLLVSAAAAGLAIAGLSAWGFAASQAAPLLAAAVIGPVLSVAFYRRSLRASFEASRLALTDQLTGLGNDRHFLERLERELDRAELDGGSLALCLIDVDDFKKINDRFGHPLGDRALAEVAACLRHGGEAFRLGGDEFALLLPSCGEESGQEIAAAVLRRVAAADYSHGDRVTASAGIAVFPALGVERSELVRAADSALYRAKAGGKDCARVYRPDLKLPMLDLLDESGGRASFYQAAAGLARAIRARGIDSGEQGSQAGELAARVAARMGLTPEHVDLIRLAGMLHDVGKLALPDELLRKPGPLTESERRVVQRHPQIGHQILDSLGADSVATWVLHHHERWDGRGYPERLAGERIPLGARILFVADAYEAMTADQGWRSKLTPEEALLELERCAGTQFDPRVVAAFVAELGEPAAAGLPDAARLTR